MRTRENNLPDSLADNQRGLNKSEQNKSMEKKAALQDLRKLLRRYVMSEINSKVHDTSLLENIRRLNAETSQQALKADKGFNSYEVCDE